MASLAAASVSDRNSDYRTSAALRILVAVTLCLGPCAVSACAHETPDIAPTAAQGADTSIVTRALDTTQYHWRRIQTPRATLYAAPSVPEPTLAQVADSIEEVISSHLAWLGGKRMESKLRLFFVGSRDEIEPITGSRAPGISETGSGAAFFVLNDSMRMGLRHETMHLLSWRLWGVPSSFWISEGVATASVPVCGGLTTGTVVAMLNRPRMLIPLEILRTSFSFSGDTGFVFYLEAADLVQFVDRVYGRDRLRAMWSTGGMANTQNTLGVDLAALERDWRAAVAARSAPAWPGWTSWRARLNQYGCS